VSIRVYTKSASERPLDMEGWLNNIATCPETIRIISVFSHRAESDSYGEYVAVVEEK